MRSIILQIIEKVNNQQRRDAKEMNISNSKEQLEKLLLENFPKEKVSKWIKTYTDPYTRLMAYYRCALLEVSTKFNVLNEELSLEYDRNPIETVKTRLKSPESLFGKMSSKKLSPTPENIENNIFDVAGVRVICSFPSDIYALADSFLKQDDITLIEKKDYIKNPKPNGYRSLHLIIETPIYLQNEKKLMKVEVQFRTISMDWWASLEHKIRYKKDIENPEEIELELLECAEMAAKLDERMEKIQQRV